MILEMGLNNFKLKNVSTNPPNPFTHAKMTHATHRHHIVWQVEAYNEADHLEYELPITQ